MCAFNFIKHVHLSLLTIYQCQVCQLLTFTEFAESEPVPGSNDGTLQMAFCDLRQLLDLFINWDWSVYLADYGKQQARYLRVQRHTAISLLEKSVSDGGVGGGMKGERPVSCGFSAMTQPSVS